jgi:HSP20 family protein
LPSKFVKTTNHLTFVRESNAHVDKISPRTTFIVRVKEKMNMSLLKRQSSSPQSLSPHTGRSLFSRLSEDAHSFWNTENIFGRRREDIIADWTPDVDVEEKNNMYLVRADLPGVNIKDVKVSVENDSLVIQGKKDTKSVAHRDSFRRVERNYGTFYRTLNLAGLSDAREIEAHLHNGVLEVVVPISETARQKKIRVLVD